MSKKILLVEDDMAVCKLYEHVLVGAGFGVVVAMDGEEGLRLAHENGDLDLILLDIMLPKVDGIEVLRRLKADEETKKLPVILLTNLGQESIIEEGFKIGAERYLMKAQHLPREIVNEINAFFAEQEKAVSSPK